ncbi:MAG: hypothetical protein HFE45_07965 [Oscillospiraceae bacterium]|jgi:hypothetical protein|nr:hypothetical protein [Oscillospiraceae bacterium]
MELPYVKWFQAGNIFSGSRREEGSLECFQYKMKKTDEGLTVWRWYGLACLEETPADAVTEKTFPLDEEGRAAASEWLMSR